MLQLLFARLVKVLPISRSYTYGRSIQVNGISPGFPFWSTVRSKEAFQYFITTSQSSVKKFLVIYQRTLLSPSSFFFFFFPGCEIFLTVGVLGALGTFLSRKFLYQLCLYNFKPSLLFILQSQLPLGSPHVSLLVFEFSGLFVLPFFMLSVLITRGHAQLIPLWLTAGLAGSLLLTVEPCTAWIKKDLKCLIWTATRWGQNPQYLLWMGHTIFRHYTIPTSVTQVSPYIASSEILSFSKWH